MTTSMECIICLENINPNSIMLYFSRTQDLIHIILCNNCKEKNVKIHQHCLNEWIKTKLDNHEDITCPHCRYKIQLTEKESKNFNAMLVSRKYFFSFT